jgi:hypothetical protein
MVNKDKAGLRQWLIWFGIGCIVTGFLVMPIPMSAASSGGYWRVVSLALIGVGVYLILKATLIYRLNNRKSVSDSPDSLDSPDC